MTTPQVLTPTQSQFLNAVLALLYRGKFWNKDLSSNMSQTLALFMPSIERLTDRAAYLLVDLFPATSTELLPEWEMSEGLPDPCEGEAPTIALRRAQVVARLTNSGGQSIAYYVNVLAQLGYVVTITQGSAFRVGVSTVGTGIGGNFVYAWTVNAPLVSVQYFRAGQGAAGEPLASWGNQVLECVIAELAPSHTVPIFVYH